MRYVLCFVALFAVLVVPSFAADVLEDVPDDTSEPDMLDQVLDSDIVLYDDGLQLYLGASGGLRLYADEVILSGEDELQPRSFGGGPAGGAYFDASTNVGDMRIFVPTDYQYGSFSLDSSGRLIGVRSSTITGYGYIGSTEYDVRFSSYAIPQYRRSDSSYTWDYLYINAVEDTNVQILDSLSSLPLKPDTGTLLLVIFAVFGGALIWICIKR